MQLTEKETQLLDRIKKGMDTPGSGWLHELLPAGMNEHQAAGVLGALIAKGLVSSQADKEGPKVCYWVELVQPDDTLTAICLTCGRQQNMQTDAAMAHRCQCQKDAPKLSFPLVPKQVSPAQPQPRKG